MQLPALFPRCLLARRCSRSRRHRCSCSTLCPPLSCCRFTGSIPDEWADPAYFLKLKSLNLQNNLLRSALPNRKWNRLGAFISLRDLDLSGNQFFGEQAQSLLVLS